MTDRIIQVTGLQRSGNHAIILWMRSLFESAKFENNRPHAVLGDPEEVARIPAEQESALIISFEDDTRHFQPGSQSLEDIVLLGPQDVAPLPVTTLYILRDPYNNWASREVAQERQGLTGLHDLAAFTANWLYIAGKHAEDPTQVILYSRWMKDADYRRAICARLGGVYSEETLDIVPHQGSGSTFDKVERRPSYRQILARLPRYLSPAFLQRLWRAPGRYIRLLATPQATARDLDTMNRWAHIVERPECAALFTDPRLRAECTRIFGFYVDETGQRIKVGPEAAE